MQKANSGSQSRITRQEVWDKVQVGYRVVCHVLDRAWFLIYRSRKLLMSIPVIYLAFYLARLNEGRLPEEVGIWILKDGAFVWEIISRTGAIYAPLGVTGASLLLMFCSRRTLYPWLISLFTMALPLLIWVINVFPA